MLIFTGNSTIGAGGTIGIRSGNATANSADSAGSIGVSAGSVSSKYGKNGGDIRLVSGSTYSNVAGTRGGNVLLQAGSSGAYGDGGDVSLRSGTGLHQVG